MFSLSELWVGVGLAGKLLMMSAEERQAFEALELRIRAILPEEYQDSYEDVQPVSMGTAALVYDGAGKVAWDNVWQSFCDLAMAGGPPHKGQLLLAASREEVEAQPERYRQVVEEICRGIEMVTGLAPAASPVPGWVRLQCTTATAGWLARAIVMENVSARCEGTMLDVPAGPGYRVEKEIKNVVTAVAKTCHYWLDHVDGVRQQKVDNLFEAMARETPLIQAAVVGHDFDREADRALRGKLGERIREATGLAVSGAICDGWVGVECPTAPAAIWMMRAMVASNVFARREGTTLFLAVNPVTDPEGETVVRVLSRVLRFARVRSVL